MRIKVFRNRFESFSILVVYSWYLKLCRVCYCNLCFLIFVILTKVGEMKKANGELQKQDDSQTEMMKVLQTSRDEEKKRVDALELS